MAVRLRRALHGFQFRPHCRGAFLPCHGLGAIFTIVVLFVFTRSAHPASSNDEVSHQVLRTPMAVRLRRDRASDNRSQRRSISFHGMDAIDREAQWHGVVLVDLSQHFSDFAFSARALSVRRDQYAVVRRIRVNSPNASGPRRVKS